MGGSNSKTESRPVIVNMRDLRDDVHVPSTRRRASPPAAAAAPQPVVLATPVTAAAAAGSLSSSAPSDRDEPDDGEAGRIKRERERKQSSIKLLWNFFATLIGNIQLCTLYMVRLEASILKETTIGRTILFLVLTSMKIAWDGWKTVRIGCACISMLKMMCVFSYVPKEM